MENLYSEDVAKMTKEKKIFLLLIAVLFAGCLMAGCLSFFLTFRFVGWLQLMAILSLGGLYTLTVHKKFSEQIRHIQFRIAVYFSIALFGAFSVLYFFQNQFDFLDVLALGCAFLLPVTIMEAWQAFNSFPKTEKRVWYYSKEILPEPNLRYIDNTRVKLKLVIDEAKMTELETSLPTTLELEKAFFYAVQAHDPFKEGDGTFFKTNDDPYGWIFYTQKPFSKTYLVPDDTIFENKIKPNTVIYAKRVD